MRRDDHHKQELKKKGTDTLHRLKSLQRQERWLSKLRQRPYLYISQVFTKPESEILSN